MTTITLLDDGRPVALPARLVADAIRVRPEALATATGWTLEAQGLCRGDVCVPVRDRGALVPDGEVDLAGFAGLLGRPLVAEPPARVAALGAAAADRAARLASLDAPDFTLPDIDGRPHSLADVRGRKALLLAWAGW